jgi:hypothetical protein
MEVIPIHRPRVAVNEEALESKENGRTSNPSSSIANEVMRHLAEVAA